MTDPVPSSPATSPASARPRKVSAEHTRTNFDLFDQRVSLEDAARQLDKPIESVSRYLSEYLTTHRITDVAAWVTALEQQRIRDAIVRRGAERRKPLFEASNGEVPCFRRRIVTTA